MIGLGGRNPQPSRELEVPEAELDNFVDFGVVDQLLDEQEVIDVGLGDRASPRRMFGSSIPKFFLVYLFK